VTETISIDPAELEPGDIVVRVMPMDFSENPGVVVTVKREIPPDIMKAISELPESVFRSLNEHS
jgi:hypothetical protein